MMKIIGRKTYIEYKLKDDAQKQSIIKFNGLEIIINYLNKLQYFLII